MTLIVHADKVYAAYESFSYTFLRIQAVRTALVDSNFRSPALCP